MNDTEQQPDEEGESSDTMGLANVEAMNGYMLADKLTPRQFSELADLDYEMAQVLYAAYATEQGDYGKLMGNISSYKVPLIDMFLFVCQQADAGIVIHHQELVFQVCTAEPVALHLLDAGGIHAVPQQRAHDKTNAAFALAALADEHEHLLSLGGWQQTVS